MRTGLLGPAHGPLLLAALVLVLAVLTWRKLPDPVFDSGREVYVAWQLSLGARFGEDVLGVYGPLSAHLHALLFSLVGASNRTLLLADLAVFATLVGLLFRLVEFAAGRDEATLVGVVVVSLFGFASSGASSLSWAAPYSHEATHGLLLAVMCLVALVRHARTGSLGSAFAAGAAWGATFLAKPEPAVAATAVLATFFALMWRAAPALGLSRVRAAAGVTAGAAIAIAVFVGLLSLRLGTLQAIERAFGAWTALARAQISTQSLYLSVTGLDDPARSLESTLESAAKVFAFIGLAGIVGRVGPSRPGWTVVGVVLCLCFTLALPWVLTTARSDATLDVFARHLPLTTAVLTAYLMRGALGASADRAATLGALPGALGAVLALALLPKLGLRAQVEHYGFTLALPATALFVVALCALARHMPARFGGGRVFAALVVAGLVTVSAWHITRTLATCATKTCPLGRAPDTILATPGRCAPLAVALAEIEARVPAGGTVAVLPEGAMLNFMAKRRSPLRYVNCNPVDLTTMSGEEAFFAPMRAEPPDLVVLVERAVREYGVRPFGEDARFGGATMAWVRANYDVVSICRPPWSNEVTAGVIVFRRRATR